MDQLLKQYIEKEFSNQVKDLKEKVLKLEQINKQQTEDIALLKEQITAKNDITRHEKYYQRKLEELIGGGHAKTRYGEIDILTDTTIYEIKAWKTYKNALGQLLFYAKDYPDRQLAKIFFGRCDLSQKKKKELLEDLRKDNIDVYQVHDELDGSVSLQLLNPRPINEPHVISQTSDIPRVVLKFVEQKCNYEKHNKTFRVFACDLWDQFQDWQTNNKVTPQLIQKQFYKIIDDITACNRQSNKITIDDKKSTGWYGINLKE